MAPFTSQDIAVAGPDGIRLGVAEFGACSGARERARELPSTSHDIASTFPNASFSPSIPSSTPVSRTPQLTRQIALNWVNLYGEAWSSQDEEKIIQLYTRDATYSERPYDQENGVYRGHGGIRDYWLTHVKQHERNIEFRQVEEALVVDTEKNTAVAQWEARFEVLQGDGNGSKEDGGAIKKKWKKVQFLQIAVLEFEYDDGSDVSSCSSQPWRVKKFSEFWHAKAMQAAPKGRRDPKARQKQKKGRCGPKRRIPGMKGGKKDVKMLSGVVINDALCDLGCDLEDGKVEEKQGDSSSSPGTTTVNVKAKPKNHDKRQNCKLRGVPLVPVHDNYFHAETKSKNQSKHGSKNGVAGVGATVGISKDVSLINWYRRAVILAGLADASDLAGIPVLRPPGAFLWEELQRKMDVEMRGMEIRPFRPPVLGREEEQQEKMKEVKTGERTSEGTESETEEESSLGTTSTFLNIRQQSSESLLYPIIGKQWYQAQHDLPILVRHWGTAVSTETSLNENANKAILFIRSREIPYLEGHAVHGNVAESVEFVEKLIEFYLRVCEEILGLRGVVRKEKGGERNKEESDVYTRRNITVSDPSIVPCSYSISIPIKTNSINGTNTSDNTNSTKNSSIDIAHIQFQGTEHGAEFGLKGLFRTSFSFTVRALGAALAVHGDNRGIVLPPRLAENQVVIVPVIRSVDRKIVGIDGETGLIRLKKWMERLREELGQEDREFAEVDGNDNREDAQPDSKTKSHLKSSQSWQNTPLRVDVDGRETPQRAKKITLYKQRGIPIVVTVQMIYDEEPVTRGEEEEQTTSTDARDDLSHALIRVCPRDFMQNDTVDQILTVGGAAKAVRREMRLLHERLLERHRGRKV